MLYVLNQGLANLRIAYERRKAVDVLVKLSDAQLLDIGLERGEIEAHVNAGLPYRSFEAYRPDRATATLQGCG